MTSIPEHPRLVEILQQMEYHPFLKHRQFHLEHALVSILAGARCRVCARVFAPPNTPHQTFYCGGAFCSQFPSDPAFLAFVAICEGMQNNFYHYWRAYRAPNRRQRSDLTLEQAWWWDSMNVFHRACEDSLRVLGPRLRNLLVTQGNGSAGGGIIRFVMEMTFNPPAYYHYEHCCFLVVLKNGTKWVFDPTGVQFGPEWPLLSPYDDYVARTQSSRYTLLQLEHLGTVAERRSR